MKRPLVNLLSLLFGDLGSRIIGFFISVYLARVLEPAGFGLMNLGLAVLGYLQLAGSPGIQILETRNAAAFVELDQARVGAVLSLRLFLASVLWILTVCVTFLFISDGTTREIIIYFAVCVFPFALMLDWVFQGKEAFLVLGGSRLIQYVVYGIVVLGVIRGASDLRFTAVAFSLGLVAAATTLWIAYTKRWGAIMLQWSPTIWRDILAKGIPVGAAIFLAQSVTNLPPLLIGYLSTAGDVGLFSSAMKLAFLLLLVDRLFNALFLPVATRYFSLHKEEVHILVETTLRFVLAVVIPLVVSGIILGKDAIVFVFGERYWDSVPLFQILLGYVALTVVNSIFVCVLVASGHEKEYTRKLTWGSMGLCVAVVGGTVLNGAYGASCGVVIGELITMLLMMNAATQVVLVPWRVFVHPLAAGACMAVTVVVLREMNPIELAAIALAVFVVIEVLLRGITAKEIRFLRERFV